MPKITIQNVGKTYESQSGEVVAVTDFSLTVEEGEFVTIVGPSGCGKSTLLYMVGGFLAPTNGRILVDGSPITGPGTDRGIVFQEYALFPWLTVADNIRYPLRQQGMPRADREATISRLIEFIGLSGFENRYPKDLSGGMKQRVAIARMLSYDPGILLMDEPFGALDAQTRELMQDEIHRIWAETGKTILLITHDVTEAVYLSDRVIVMTARPGMVKTEVSVRIDRDAPREEVMVRDDFNEVRNGVWLAVREEVLKARGAGVEAEV